MNQAASRRSPLERFLGIFTEVHAGEGPVTLLMAFNVFLLLTSYYLIKPVREALILSGGGAEAKSYLVGAMAVVPVLPDRLRTRSSFRATSGRA